MNDQQPSDVAPDDERRPAAAAQASDSTFSSYADAPASPGGTAPAPDDEHRARRKRHRIAALSVAAAVVFTAGAGGGAAASLALARSATASSSGVTQQGGTAGQLPQGGFGGSQNGFGGSQGGFGSGGQGSSGSSTSSATTATSDQIAGLVTVVTELGYQSGEAAGTGIILTANGRILTNNHVIDGATAIRVTDVSTGRTYTADVVGTNATRDVAVLQLEDASGLTPADIATTAPSVGDDVTAVGNANGTGTLSAAEGSVTALDQTITTSSEGSTSGRTLHGLIEIAADVVSGDSGGAVENADGEVVGVTTAASSGAADITGYAIPIDSALSIASQIVAGDDTDEITIGLPAFLGISIANDSSTTRGAVVGQVLDGTAASGTDLAAGDVITRIGGTAVASAEELSAAIAERAPGDSVRLTYTDTDGDSHTVTVTLTEGPAD